MNVCDYFDKELIIGAENVLGINTVQKGRNMFTVISEILS